MSPPVAQEVFDKYVTEHESVVTNGTAKAPSPRAHQYKKLSESRIQMNIHDNPLEGTDKGTLHVGTIRVHLKGHTLLSHRTRFERCLLGTVILLLVTAFVFMYLAFLRPSQFGGQQVCLTSDCVRTASSLLSAMDQTADPCEDFFQYACGIWNKKHIIPEDRSSISTFEVLADELQIILKDLLEEPTNLHDNNATIKAKVFYASCMKTHHIEKIGDAPIREVIQTVGGWPVVNKNWSPLSWSFEIFMGVLKRDYNLGIVVEPFISPDDKNSSVNIIQLDQIHFGLPSRDYFLKESSLREREAYHRLMVDLAVLHGADLQLAEKEMQEVLDFETMLANFSLSEADRHDTGAIYNKMSLRRLSELVPEISWVDYLNMFLPTIVTEDEPIVVYALPYLQHMGKKLRETEQRTIHNYAVWRFINQMLPYLDGEYSQKRAEFRKILQGVSAERVRWTQCVDLVNKKLGMAVGALFIRDNFDPKSKETALEMIHNIREAFNELLEENDWMDEETRQVAKEKANAINERIGYPDLLTKPDELSKEYQSLNLKEELFLRNILNILKYESSKNLLKLRKPVNKDKWNTEPAVVNAFYNPNKNDIVFPAGILQPLFYCQHFPKSLNYGGIGVVIGHEITHGFDDKGRQFDKDGNMKQWWNNATVRRFRERAQCIIDQYSSYVLEEVGSNTVGNYFTVQMNSKSSNEKTSKTKSARQLYQINGKMTQGENIADNGGLKQAYRAYKKWVVKNGEEPLLPGLKLTHDQLFFLNYAQIWCGSMRPEDALSKIRSSVHSPGPIRTLGPLSNSLDFARVYSCPVGSRMNPVKKCSVW